MTTPFVEAKEKDLTAPNFGIESVFDFDVNALTASEKDMEVSMHTQGQDGKMTVKM
jgi:hypothetical protein